MGMGRGVGRDLDVGGRHEVGVSDHAVEELLQRDAAALDKALLEARAEEVHRRFVGKRGDKVAGKVLRQLFIGPLQLEAMSALK